MEKNNKFIVEFVAPGSPAEKSGFKTGDGITLINQKPVKLLQGQAWQRAALGSLRSTGAGIIYVFTMEDGSNKQLKTDDFF